MRTTDKMRTPTLAGAGDAEVESRLATATKYSIKPLDAIAMATRCVRLAARIMREATFRLDDGGYRCEALEHLAADTFALAATWTGRPVPNIDEELPGYIVEGAREWRRKNRRSS